MGRDDYRRSRERRGEWHNNNTPRPEYADEYARRFRGDRTQDEDTRNYNRDNYPGYQRGRSMNYADDWGNDADHRAWEHDRDQRNREEYYRRQQEMNRYGREDYPISGSRPRDYNQNYDRGQDRNEYRRDYNQDYDRGWRNAPRDEMYSQHRERDYDQNYQRRGPREQSQQHDPARASYERRHQHRDTYEHDYDRDNDYSYTRSFARDPYRSREQDYGNDRQNQSRQQDEERRYSNRYYPASDNRGYDRDSSPDYNRQYRPSQRRGDDGGRGYQRASGYGEPRYGSNQDSEWSEFSGRDPGGW